MKTIDNYKDELAKTLKESPDDVQRILELSHQIARLDDQAYRLTVDSSHVDILGMQLVSKQETALSELIKNSYDADATEVDVEFIDSLTPGGSLVISDNGVGMTSDDIRDGFMRISTNFKSLRPTSRKFERPVSGRKGIGRFSTQRLGSKLTIVTRSEDSQSATELKIDWDAYQRGSDLMAVSHRPTATTRKTPGTTFTINNLRDSWTESKILGAYKHISGLLSPTSLISPENTGEQSFSVTVKQTATTGERRVTKPLVDQHSAIFSHAMAEISGWIDDQGVARFTVESKVLPKAKWTDINDEPLFRVGPKSSKEDLSKNYAALRGVKLKAYYFVHSELPRGASSLVRSVLKQNAGIKLYRNNFKVMPYGSGRDDWLSLQQSSAIRDILPPHHNNNFMGSVEVNDLDGLLFEETASREGLIENEAFEQLTNFTRQVLLSAVLQVSSARGIKLYASDPSPSASNPHATPETANETAEELLESNPEDPKSQAAASALKDLATQNVELMKEARLLRILAGMGLTITDFSHDIRQTLTALDAAAQAIVLQGDTPNNRRRYESCSKGLNNYLAYFEMTVSENADRKLKPIDLVDAARQFVNVFEPLAERKGITIEPLEASSLALTTPMHPAEWHAVFLNLYTNSVKAINKTSNVGKIKLELGCSDNQIYLDFSDNGCGIAAEDKPRIFDHFFTTALPSSLGATDAEELTGSGIGLAIVKDIVESSGGRVMLVSPLSGYATTFRVSVPIATEDETSAG